MPPASARPETIHEDRPARPGVNLIAWVAAALLAATHGWGIWSALGGWSGLTSPWPIARHDHPLYLHSAWVTKSFLRQTGTTSGYDPYFMAGYPKSVVFPASSTLPELVGAFFGGNTLVQAYKWYVFIATTAVPFVILTAARVARLTPTSALLGLGLFLIYLWTDFPINYAAFGMIPYLLGVPLAVLTVAVFGRYLEHRSATSWLLTVALATFTFLTHLTTAMLLFPACLLTYLIVAFRPRESAERLRYSGHLAVWAIPNLVLVLNAFWWWPGVWLASTRGDSSFAFAHSSESIHGRFIQIVTSEPPIQATLLGLGALGFCFWTRRNLVSQGLTAMAIAGFFWGYLAALTPGLDFLQPGRHTYAFYSVLSLAAGWFLSEWGARLRSVSPIGPGLGLVALVLIAGRLFGPTLANSVESRLRAPAMLSSEPTDRLRFVLDEVKKHLRAGDRLLYEESGFSLPGIPDPYSDGRYSGLLPYLTGIEVVGGPYLHSAVVNNFTQFGEGRLFGLENWSEPDFLRYARLYRPRAILCWSPRAVRFCRSHPELIEIRAEDSRDLPFRDPRSGRVGLARSELLFGIVRGFEGATIDGEAAVDAEAGRLVVRSEAESSEGASELDAPAVLRYHYAPYLRSTPPVRLEPVLLESDPVPFIRLSPSRTGQPQIIMLDTPP